VLWHVHHRGLGCTCGGVLVRRGVTCGIALCVRVHECRGLLHVDGLLLLLLGLAVPTSEWGGVVSSVCVRLCVLVTWPWQSQ